jgi:predicted transcriptional regulator
MRSQNEIIITILEACRRPSVQRLIMIKARLGYETFWTRMNRLLNENMLKCSSKGKKTVYSVTGAGLTLLEKLVTSEGVFKFAQKRMN